LHGAAANGQINTAKLLLENGAGINKIDVDEETPLFKTLKYLPFKEQSPFETAKFFIKAMLEQNPEQEKPDYIEDNKVLSEYWNECIDLNTCYYTPRP